MTCVFGAAKLTHIGPIANRMREIDRIECAALGRNPKNALRSGLRFSSISLTASDEHGPQAMMGVVPEDLMAGRGTVWMLGSDAIYDHGRDLLIAGPVILAAWLRAFRRLENIVAVENDRAIRLLRHWGFTIGEDIETHSGVTFLPFFIERSSQHREPIQGERNCA